MSKKVLVLAVLLAQVALFSGCASIICGSEKTVNINSSPLEAKFTIENDKGKIIAQGVTPTNVTLKRGSGFFKAGDYTIKLEKPGYKPTVLPVKQGVEAGWYGLGNIVFGGLIGWVIVDPLTGAMWTIEDFDTSLLPEETVFNFTNQRPELSPLPDSVVRLN